MTQPVRRNPPPKRGTAKRSPRAFYLGLAVIAVAGIGVLGYLSTRPRDQALAQVDPSLPRVESNGYVLGSAAAPLEVVEFGDFECPQCSRFATLTEPDVRTRLVNTGIVRMRYIDFPLSMHKNTWPASRSAACADEQGKFWEMHDALYNSQDRWNGEATSKPEDVFKDLARQIGLNQQQFDSCLDTRKTQAKVQAHEQIALTRQIGSTPTFVFGNRVVPGAITYDEFKQYVDAALAKQGSPVNTAPATKAPSGR